MRIRYHVSLEALRSGSWRGRSYCSRLLAAEARLCRQRFGVRGVKGHLATAQQSAKRSRLLQHVCEPTRCVLLIQEMQNGVVGSTSSLPALAAAGEQIGLIDHVVAVATAARHAGVPVIHTTAESMPGGFGSNHNARLFAAARKAAKDLPPDGEAARPIPELGPAPGDLVFPRHHGLSPLSGTSLDQLLRNAGVTTVVIAGVSLNVAIPNLVFDAVNLGYQVVLVSDAVVATPVEYGEQIIEHSLSLVATVVSSAELEAVWARAMDEESVSDRG
jgi:biuret amidohydrolase